MNILDYLHLIRRRLPLVGAVVGIVSLISLGMAMRQQPSYEAAVRIRTRQIAPMSPANSFLEEQGLQSDLATEAQLIASEKVASIVTENLELPGKPSDLLEMIDVFPVEGTAIMAIRVRTPVPQFSMDLANGFADAYLEVRRAEAGQVIDQALQQAATGLNGAQQRLIEADARLAGAAPGSVTAAEAEAERNLALADVVAVRSLLRDLADRSAVQSGFGEIIQPADEANLLSTSSPTRSVTFGALLGIPLALAIVLLLDSLSETIRSPADAMAIAGADVVGMIPFDERIATYTGGLERRGRQRGRQRGRRPRNRTVGPLAVDNDPFSLVSEAYRTASLGLEGAAQDAGCTRILITSALAGEGKTTTLSNLVASTAERERTTLLIDADLRRPAAHRILDAEADPGLAEVAAGDATPRKAVQEVRPHLTFVGSGTPVERPDQLLTRMNLRQIIDKLAAVGNRPHRRTNGNGRAANGGGEATVFIDSAPILQAAETLALVRAVDGVVLVVRAGATRKQAVARAVEQIHRAGGVLLGVLLVGVSNELHLGLAGPNPRQYRRDLALVGDGAEVAGS